jgi:hypothetical protein
MMTVILGAVLGAACALGGYVVGFNHGVRKQRHFDEWMADRYPVPPNKESK